MTENTLLSLVAESNLLFIMAYNEMVKGRAKAMYEGGTSHRAIASELGIANDTVIKWIDEGDWEKGKTRAEIERAEHLALIEGAKQRGFDKARILKELEVMGLVNPGDFYEEIDGVWQLKPLKDIGENTRAIKTVKTRTQRKYNRETPNDVDITQTIEIGITDKLGALVEAGNIMGIKKDGDDTQSVFQTFFDGLGNKKDSASNE